MDVLGPRGWHKAFVHGVGAHKLLYQALMISPFHSCSSRMCPKRNYIKQGQDSVQVHWDSLSAQLVSCHVFANQDMAFQEWKLFYQAFSQLMVYCKY